MVFDFLGSLHRPKVDRRTVLVALCLAAIFSAALGMRIMPARHGFFLNEFDPYFDYYATKFIVDKYDAKGILGTGEYFTWKDNRTWFPEGRQVATSSQVGLQFAGAGLYIMTRDFLRIPVSLYDFLVLFPVYFGSLTTLVVFFLVRRLGGTVAGLLGALIFAFSSPVIVRGNLGWYKSEPFALFLAVTALFLLLKGVDPKISRQRGVALGLLVGLLLGYANASWGGSQFFSIILALTFIAIAFLGGEMMNILPTAASAVSLTLLVSALSPRPGPSFVSGPVGLILLGSLLFLWIARYLRRTVEPRVYRRSLLKTLLGLGLLAATLSGLGLTSGVSGRYLTAVYPFQRSGDPLVESVAEHFVPTGIEYLSSYWVLGFLSVFGAYLLLRRRGFTSVFALILGLSSLYVASSFTRLMVYSSLAFAILGGIGFVEVTSTFLRPSPVAAAKRRLRASGLKPEAKFLYAAFMILLLTVPLIFPRPLSWLAVADTPVSIYSSGIPVGESMPDWLEALEWIRLNTKKDAVFASWWDYGYWITVMGNRTSLADNATLNSTRISLIGRMFMSNETEGLRILDSLRADYVVVFVAGQRAVVQGSSYYVLGAGGDESKMQWFMKIGGLQVEEFLYEDSTPKPHFWDNTVLGSLFPFKLTQYLGRQDGQLQFAGTEWKRGNIPLYVYQITYPEDSKGPFRLAFSSSSLAKTGQGIFAGVLIYEIVKPRPS